MNYIKDALREIHAGMTKWEREKRTISQEMKDKHGVDDEYAPNEQTVKRVLENIDKYLPTAEVVEAKVSSAVGAELTATYRALLKVTDNADLIHAYSAEHKKMIDALKAVASILHAEGITNVKE